jgi:putative nucleotidyltransferase with HDIG domain
VRGLHIPCSNRLVPRAGISDAEGTDPISTPLYVLAGWFLLGLLAYLLLLPLLKASRRAERLWSDTTTGIAEASSEGTPRGLAEASRSGVPSPQRLGYSGLILQRLAQHARTVLGVHRAWIAVSPPGADHGYTGVAAAGMDPDVIGTRFSTPCELGGAASAPVTVGAEPRGALCVADPVNGGLPGSLERSLLAGLAVLTGKVLAHHERRQLASGDSKAEINALVTALGMADGATYRHSLEVAATARALGRRLGLPDVDLVEVELGALLHDVGKLRLPPQILRKAGPLDADETRLVRLHPEWGAEMVASVPGLEAVALIVRLHHERPDGNGYPHGLIADRIPMASRIVSACDAYGAMTRRRDYSEPLKVDAALEELELNAGTQFDPLVVEVLAEFVREPVAVAV